jgi:hypothetical protein
MDSTVEGNDYERHAGNTRAKSAPLPQNFGEVGNREREEDKRAYSKPEFRNRDTGSITGTGSRLNNQRATTNPSAAYQTCMSFIKNPHEQPYSCSGGVELASTYL